MKSLGPTHTRNWNGITATTINRPIKLRPVLVWIARCPPFNWSDKKLTTIFQIQNLRHVTKAVIFQAVCFCLYDAPSSLCSLYFNKDAWHNGNLPINPEDCKGVRLATPHESKWHNVEFPALSGNAFSLASYKPDFQHKSVTNHVYPCIKPSKRHDIGCSTPFLW